MSAAQIIPFPSTDPKQLVINSVSESSRRIYAAAIDDFMSWRRSQGDASLTKAKVQRYRAHLEAQGLAPSTINVRLSAIRKLAVEMADNNLLDAQLAAGVSRAKGAKSAGVRFGNWLTREQAEKLLAAPNTGTVKGVRDAALLAVLVGCGLRREECSSLEFTHVQQREGRWVIVDLIGKGSRVRTVPMPGWCKHSLDEWSRVALISTGRFFRPVNKGGRIAGDSMTAQAVFKVITAYAIELGFGNITPHDLRRTFAKLAHRGNAAIEQISLSLGHSSIVTTERYLGVRQDLSDAPCDHLGLRPHF